MFRDCAVGVSLPPLYLSYTLAIGSDFGSISHSESSGAHRHASQSGPRSVDIGHYPIHRCRFVGCSPRRTILRTHMTLECVTFQNFASKSRLKTAAMVCQLLIAFCKAVTIKSWIAKNISTILRRRSSSATLEKSMIPRTAQTKTTIIAKRSDSTTPETKTMDFN